MFRNHDRFALSLPVIAVFFTRTIATEDALRDEALHESHTPAEFRINGIINCQDEWYQDFEVYPDETFYLPPENRVELW